MQPPPRRQLKGVLSEHAPASTFKSGGQVIVDVTAALRAQRPAQRLQ